MKRFLNVTAVLSLLGLLGFAFAQTGAGTPITNTATATYTNAANQTLTAQSNTVTTTVQPIYRFAITPNGTDTAGGTGQTQTGAAGSTTVFTYQLENQGNTGNAGNTAYPNGNTINLSAVDSATDNFNFGDRTIYLDNPNAGIQGQLDPQDTVVTSVTVPYGQVVTLFVEAAIPATATDTQVGRLNLEGRSATGGETDLDNWAELTAFTNAALTLNKTATGNAIPGGTISYNVSGTNTQGTNPYAVGAVANITNGGNPGPRDGILVSDVIPAGLTYTQNSLTVTSNTTNIVAPLYSTNGGASWVTVQPASGVNAVALLIVGNSGQRINTSGGATFTYQLTFQATVPANAAAGTTYANTGTIRYDSNGDGDSADTGETVSNPTPATTTVSPSGTFAVGPYTFPAAGASGTYTVPNEGYTVTRSGDTQTIASAPNERDVSFRQSLRNATNFDDTYTLSSTLPAGFPGSVSFYAVNPDGSRGALITGPLAVAAGATTDFYTVVALPADYTTTAPLNVAVTATSTNGAANGTNAADTTTDTISAVTEAQAVDIGNYDGDGIPNDTSVNFPAQPGSTVNIPLIVRNNGADPDTFDLTTLVGPAFPAGYVLTLYTDENCDGIVDGTDAPVTAVGPLEPATFTCLIVQITVPAGASPETYDVTVTATSRNDPNISNSVTDTVTVGLLEDFTFTPTPQSQATSATVPVVYTHTITNNSNDAASVDLTFDGGTTGWTYEYSLTGAPGSYSTTLPQDIPVAAGGGTQTVYVRVTPAPGALEGDQDSFTLTATPTYGTVTGTAASVTDTTTIDQEFFGQLNLDKTVDATQAEPGDTLTYTVTATNIGSGALTNVKVQDAVPANTTFVSATANASGGLAGDIVLYSTNGTTWSQTAPPTLATGASIYVGVSTNGDNTINASDAFPASGVLTLTLTVTIN